MGHVQRPSRRKNLPKAPIAPAFVRWTIPQACVWLWTYDQAKADSLTPEDARLMMMGPDILAPLACLRAALVAGRFPMWGRPVALMPDYSDQILNDVDEITPHAFWLADGGFSIELEQEDIAATVYAPESIDGPQFHRRWIRLYFDRDEIIGNWQSPRMLLGDGPCDLAGLVRDGYLRAGPEDNLSWLLGRDDVTVERFDSDSVQLVKINPRTLAMSRPEIDGDDLVLSGARLPGVVLSLSLRQPEPQGAPAPQDNKTTGRTAPYVDRLSNRKKAHELLLEIYGPDCWTNGRLTNETTPAVQRALREKGLSLGYDAVRVVLGRKKP